MFQHPLRALRQGGVQTINKGSKGRSTQCTPQPCLLRTNTFKARYPPALLPLFVLLNLTPKMRTEPSLQREGQGRGMPPLQAPSCRPLLLLELTLVPATSSYLATTFFTASTSKKRDTKLYHQQKRRPLP